MRGWKGGVVIAMALVAVAAGLGLVSDTLVKDQTCEAVRALSVPGQPSGAGEQLTKQDIAALRIAARGMVIHDELRDATLGLLDDVETLQQAPKPADDAAAFGIVLTMAPTLLSADAHVRTMQDECGQQVRGILIT